MNELLFLTQIACILAFTLCALKIGKEALVVWIVIQAFIANLFVLKQITLWGLHVTASDAFAVGSLLGLECLQEKFGKKEAKQTIWICFFCMLFFVIVSQLHLLYLPNEEDSTQMAFETLLTPSPRLLFASMSVFLIVQQLEIHLFSFLKRQIPQANFAYRASTTLVFSQVLDTVLFSFVGLYGIVSSIFDLILMSLLIKLIVITCFTPVIRYAKI